MLSPEERNLIRTRYRYFKRTSGKDALEKTIEWFKRWFRELARREVPEDHLREIVEFLEELEETL